MDAGKKYKICDDFSEYTGTYLYSIYGVHSFVNINGNHNFQDFYLVTFYEPIFQRERIQSEMEQRAVNLLLRVITGDPTFTW